MPRQVTDTGSASEEGSPARSLLRSLRPDQGDYEAPPDKLFLLVDSVLRTYEVLYSGSDPPLHLGTLGTPSRSGWLHTIRSVPKPARKGTSHGVTVWWIWKSGHPRRHTARRLPVFLHWLGGGMGLGNGGCQVASGAAPMGPSSYGQNSSYVFEKKRFPDE